MKNLAIQKISACMCHLLISLAVITLFFVYIVSYLYPDNLFYIENVWQGLRILVPVDVILGPLLTLAVYAPKKKDLKKDLMIIGLCQLLALIYGAYSIYRMRPSIIAFTIDRFNVVTQKQLEGQKLPLDRFNKEEIHYPMMVYAKRPDKSGTLGDLQKNLNFENNPNNYYPVNKYREQVLKKQFDLVNFQPINDQQRKIKEAYLSKPEILRQKQAIFIVQGSTYDVELLVMNKKTFNIEGYLAINPWETIKTSD